MKIFKKIITFLLAFSLMVSFPLVSAFAETNGNDDVSKETIIQYMKNIGTPQEFLDSITDHKLHELYYRFQDKNMKFGETQTEIVTIPNTNSSDGVQPYGGIPDSKLELSVTTFDECTDSNLVVGVAVEASFKWLSSPILQLTDAMTLNWNGELLSMQGFFAESGYILEGLWVPIQSISNYSTAQKGGVGCYLSIAQREEISGDPTQGTMSVYLVPRKSYYYHDILKEQLFFEYAHQTVGLSISMGASIGHPISGSVGIGFTGGSYDSRGFAKNYHFDKNDH